MAPRDDFTDNDGTVATSLTSNNIETKSNIYHEDERLAIKPRRTKLGIAHRRTNLSPRVYEASEMWIGWYVYTGYRKLDMWHDT